MNKQNIGFWDSSLTEEEQKQTLVVNFEYQAHYEEAITLTDCESNTSQDKVYNLLVHDFLPKLCIQYHSNIKKETVT